MKIFGRILRFFERVELGSKVFPDVKLRFILIDLTGWNHQYKSR